MMLSHQNNLLNIYKKMFLLQYRFQMILFATAISAISESFLFFQSKECRGVTLLDGHALYKTIERKREKEYIETTAHTTYIQHQINQTAVKSNLLLVFCMHAYSICLRVCVEYM